VNPNYRKDIDGLRALAIALVVIFHLFPNLIKGGFIGVDVFFVISGYLISNIILRESSNKTFTFRDFYIRRIKRIFPALLTVFLITFVFAWFNLLPIEFKDFGKHIAAGSIFSSNFLLLNESGYFDKASESKPFLHLWSLAIEEQFYLIWPVLFIFILKRKAYAIPILATLILISFVINIAELWIFSRPESAYYLPQTRFWELLCGALIAVLAFHGKIPNFEKKISIPFIPNYSTLQSSLLSFIGVGSVILASFLISKDSPFPGYIALAPVLGTAFIIIAGPKAWLNQKILSLRGIVFLGLISFPLYLWHWVIFSLATITQPFTLSNIDKLLILFASLLMALLTYICIERPLKKVKSGNLVTIILVFLMVICGYIGFNTYQRNGLEFRNKYLQHRYPIELQKLAPPHYLQINKQRDLLQNHCDSNHHDNFVRHFGQCNIGTSTKANTIFLWGDSYAEHLINGYVKFYGSNHSINLINTSGCPPIPNTEIQKKKECGKFYEKTMKYFSETKPQQVVIAANWTDYNWKLVEETIKNLKSLGIPDVKLIGPAPQWNDSLYKQLLIHHQLNSQATVPYRMTFGLNPKFLAIDKSLKEISKKHDFVYYSISDILCSDLGCITRFGETGDTLTTFDGGHFTPITSEYVVSLFKKSE